MLCGQLLWEHDEEFAVLPVLEENKEHCGHVEQRALRACRGYDALSDYYCHKKLVMRQARRVLTACGIAATAMMGDGRWIMICCSENVNGGGPLLPVVK